MTTPAPLTKQETAWLMKTIWKALQAPKWGFFNAKDLEALGKAIASGKDIRDLPSDTIDRIWPHLITVTNHLGAALKQNAAETPATTSGAVSEPTSTTVPASPDADPSPPVQE